MKDKQAAIIGGGVIGGGWAARFALNGWQVNLFDPDPEAARKMSEVMENARASLPQLADIPLPEEGRLVICDSLEEAVSKALWIQESIPERLEIKRTAFADIQTYCRDDAVIASSTSGFKPSELRAEAKQPDQIIVAHPYNPVYLLPAVELVGGIDNKAVLKAEQILNSLGMKPIILRREIDAHVGDRLLEALWREALWLVKDDVATTSEIDEIISYSFGLRWAQMGLFETYRVAGGEAGMRHFMAQFGPALSWPWTKLMDVPELDDALIEKIASQSDSQSGHYTIRELEAIRDKNLVGFLKVLKGYKWGAGRVYDNWLKDEILPEKTLADKNWIPETPFAQHHAEVLPAWIDYNGHMTEFRYLQVMSDAADCLLTYLGLSQAYVEAGFSIYTVETHIRHLAEAKLGEKITVATQILSADERKIRLWHSLKTEAGIEVATGEQMWLHVDMKAGRTAPMQGILRQRMLALFEAHQSLAMPEGAGRYIGQKSGQ
jgi:carnitine 3-dehydrogenase